MKKVKPNTRDREIIHMYYKLMRTKRAYNTLYFITLYCLKGDLFYYKNSVSSVGSIYGADIFDHVHTLVRHGILKRKEKGVYRMDVEMAEKIIYYRNMNKKI